MHEVLWVGEWATDPGDDEILERARQEERVLVTLDRDFGELAIVHRRPHCGIVRLVNIAARQQGLACARALERYADELPAGAIVTVEPGRIRFRPAAGSAEGQ